MTLNELIVFMKQAVLSPVQIGAAFPTGSRLAKVMVEKMNISSEHYVLEIGAGTGSITTELVKKINPLKSLIVEINPQFSAYLKEQFPTLNICNNSIEDLDMLMQNYNIRKFDYIVCSIPWSHFSPAYQDLILNKIYQNMDDKGSFFSVSCVHGLLLRSAQRFRRNLNTLFSEVHTTPIVWKTIPPCMSYYCKK